MKQGAYELPVIFAFCDQRLLPSGQIAEVQRLMYGARLTIGDGRTGHARFY